MVAIIVRLPDELHDKLDLVSKIMGVPKQTIIEQSIVMSIEQLVKEDKFKERAQAVIDAWKELIKPFIEAGLIDDK